MSVIGPYVKITCEQPSCSNVVDDFDYSAFQIGKIPRGWTVVGSSRRHRCPNCSGAAEISALKGIVADLLYDIDNGEPISVLAAHVHRTKSLLTNWLEESNVILPVSQ